MPTRHTEDQSSTRDPIELLYERCLEEIKQRLEHSATLTAEAVQAAAYAVRDNLAASVGEHQEDLNRVIDTLVEQWQQVLTQGEQIRQHLHQNDTMQALTEHGVSLLAHLAGTVKSLAGEVESRLQRQLEYRTGMVVGAGNFLCSKCAKEVRKTKTGPLPPCSRCHGTVFHRRS
jgi:hypothetical protein